MKLNSKILVAVVMMFGAVATMGCNPSAEQSAVAPEENVASAPVEENAEASNENYYRARFYFGPRYYAPYAPPAYRYERVGYAPSHRHFWAPGYYRWSGRQYVWYSGRWEIRRPGYSYVNPRWHRTYGRWQYIPGHWVRA